MRTVLHLSILLVATGVIYWLMNPSVNFEVDAREGVRFQRGSWQQALQLAGQQKKLIFLDVYARWCGPCKRLKAHTFSDPTVGTYFNTHFISVAVDGESPAGLQLMEHYALTAFPSLLFLDAQGHVIQQETGFQTSSQLLTLGKQALSLEKRPE